MTEKKIIRKSLVAAFILFPFYLFSQTSILVANNGKVKFTSDAPMESIKATSDKLKGAIDKSKGTFAFSVEMLSFRGFNGDLQREHFHENYIETEKYPTASFSGKFIEQVDFATDGIYSIRAKGMFNIHGIEKERIIKGTLTIKNGSLLINADFSVKLEDHDIKVPKIVYEKIAEEIKVEINIHFKE